MWLHGRHEVGSSGNLLSIEAWGPWNLEAARDFDRAVRQAVAGLAGASWGQIACLHGDSVYTPESVPVIEALHLWRVEQGLRCIAIVHDVGSPAAADVTEYQFNTIYSADPQGRCVLKYFFDREEALAWLAVQGYRP